MQNEGMAFSYPHRTLHLIDIENLLRTARPTHCLALSARRVYWDVAAVSGNDHVIIACNHGAALNVGLAFRGCRLLLQSGPDGADLALLSVLADEHAVDRFDAVIIASGDGSFATAVAELAAAAMPIAVIARPHSVSRRLRLAAGGIVTPFSLIPGDPLDGPPEPATPAALGGVA
jgi:hypothetical protein